MVTALLTNMCDPSCQRHACMHSCQRQVIQYGRTIRLNTNCVRTHAGLPLKSQFLGRTVVLVRYWFAVGGARRENVCYIQFVIKNLIYVQFIIYNLFKVSVKGRSNMAILWILVVFYMEYGNPCYTRLCARLRLPSWHLGYDDGDMISKMIATSKEEEG